MKKPVRVLQILITVLLISNLISCSDDNTTGSGSTTYYTITSVDGTINGMSPDVRNLRAVVLTDTTFHTINSQTIGSNNTMSINLPAPSAGELIDIDYFFLNVTTNNVNISDHNALVNFLSFHMLDSNGILKGFLNKDNRTTVPINQSGFTRLGIIYSDRNLNLSGKSIAIAGGDTNVINYNTSLTTGWNVTTQTIIASRTNYTESNITGGEVIGMSWYYENLTANKLNSYDRR